MRKMRIPLLAALIVAVIGIIFGSIFDYRISEAIASPTNGFALAVSAIGPTIAFAAVSAMGGGFIAFVKHGNYHKALKALFIVLAIACYGVSIYFPGGEYFGVNGFVGAAPEWAGYLIVIIPEAAAFVGGYFLFKDCKNPNMWIVFCVVILLLCIVLLAGVTGLKGIMHRPRYRLISNTDKVGFHQWWEPCSDYRQLINDWGFQSDDFKSYPSGHTAEASILLAAATFFPLGSEKLSKIQLPLFLGSCGMVLLVAFARILAAAHFLSDVSTGATLMLIFAYIANEVLIHVKAVHLMQPEPEEE